jgi:hypothetical protein
LHEPKSRLGKDGQGNERHTGHTLSMQRTSKKLPAPPSGPTTITVGATMGLLTGSLYPTRTQMGGHPVRYSVACSTEPVRHKRNGTARQLAGETRHCPWLMDLGFSPTPTRHRHRTTSGQSGRALGDSSSPRPVERDTGAPTEATGLDRRTTRERESTRGTR